MKNIDERNLRDLFKKCFERTKINEAIDGSSCIAERDFDYLIEELIVIVDTNFCEDES